MAQPKVPVPEIIAQRIHLVRGQKVMLDADLASLYGVETRVLVQAVKRNLRRFPVDFMFQLTDAEWVSLRSQNVTSKGRGGRRAIRQLMAPPARSKRPIGFVTGDSTAKAKK